jgi:phage terminase large subunit-like protein
MMFAITTAGHTRLGVCVDQRDYGRKLVENLMTDESYFFVDYGLDEGDDPFELSSWVKSNPNYGISIQPDTFELMALKAQNQKSELNNFLCKNLNVWVNSAEAFFDMEKWDKCKEDYNWEDFKKCDDIYAGLDLSSTQDLTVLSLVGKYEGKILTYFHFYLPEDNMENRVRKDKVNYDLWAKDGLLTLTPGDTVDYNFIKKDLGTILDEVNINELVFDNWNSSQIITDIQEELGLTCVAFPQTFKFYSPVIQDMEVRINRQTIWHNNPILSWCISNMVVITDANGNVRPDKTKVTEKIDGAVALFMAIYRLTANTTQAVFIDSKGHYFG